jgi:hypothetical protein
LLSDGASTRTVNGELKYSFYSDRGAEFP